MIKRIITTFSITVYSAPIAFAQEANKLTQNTIVLPENVQQFTEDQINTVKEIITTVIDYSVKYGFQVLGGFIVLGIGWLIAGKVAEWINGLLAKQKIDVTVNRFISGAVKITIIGFAGIVALSKFGIEIAPLIAGISVAGVGVSFALQGPLSNYASGIALIFTKPFKVGEIIEVADVMGEVTDMKLPRTELKTLDGNMVVIPNKHIIGEIIHNYSVYKRMDLVFGVSYNEDMDQVMAIIKDTILAESRLAEGKQPKIGITEFADSSVNFFVRLWCKQDEWWDVKFSLNKAVWDAFKKHNIEIPFPQRDVHLFNEDKK